MIYHLVHPTHWNQFSEQALYFSETFDQEGFIHFSTESQVAGVLQRYYRGMPRLLNVHVDEAKLTSELRFEAATGGDLFPHVYGPLNREAVVTVEEILQPLTIGLVLFPRLTQLDLTGPYEVFCRLPGAQVLLVSETPEPVLADRGLALVPSLTFETCPPLDVLCVPGGPGITEQLENPVFLDFLRKQGAQARYVTSVCTGSLLLAAAGLLRGYRATTHWLSLDLLRMFDGVTVSEDRVVRDRNRFTGGGVTAGIDFALTLAAELYGTPTAQSVQLTLEYNPQPPFNAGHPSVASPELVEQIRTRAQPAQQQRAELIDRLAHSL
ncbi:MAG: DUF952 domain-containing protein [Cytophagaceae bacterium]|nr:DUF952 domain-containing protein [Cytophagaceae bacterium]